MSVVFPLSEQSIAAGSTPVKCPDFTSGKWETTKPKFAVDRLTERIHGNDTATRRAPPTGVLAHAHGSAGMRTICCYRATSDEPTGRTLRK